MAKRKNTKEEFPELEFPEFDAMFAEQDRIFKEAFKAWDAALDELFPPFSIEPLQLWRRS